MNKYREIVTKAVIAKGRKTYSTAHLLLPEKKASKVLGCWIIAHQCHAKYQEEVIIEGSYDVHIWYAHSNDTMTDVMQRKITYSEIMPVKIKSGEILSDKTELKVMTVKYPACISLKLIDEAHIEAVVEKELILDGIGDATLRVQISDDFEDEFLQDQDIDNNINVNFLKKTL